VRIKYIALKLAEEGCK